MDDEINAIVDALGRLECDDKDEPKGLNEALKAPRKRRLETTTAAEELGERNVRLLRQAIRAIGIDAARGLLDRTIQVQRTGGLLTADESRKRSSGGVFFYLLRDVMDPTEYKTLMNTDKKKRRAHHKAKMRRTQ